jgi:hypothetical protein
MKGFDFAASANFCCRRGQLHGCQLKGLIEADPYIVNKRHKSGCTLLCLAIADEYEPHVRLLCEAGADPNVFAPSSPGYLPYYPITHALMHTTPVYRIMTELLLFHGAAFPTPSWEFYTPDWWKDLKQEYHLREHHCACSVVAMLGLPLRQRLGWCKGVAKLVALQVWSLRRRWTTK